SSVFELQAELNRARLVALQTDRAEASRVPVGASRNSRVAEDDAIGHVAALRLEAQPVAVMEGRHLEDADVFDDVAKAANRAVTSRSIAELQWTRIDPGCLVEVAVLGRIEATQVGDASRSISPVRALDAVGQETG